jgi:hypothetical protein
VPFPIEKKLVVAVASSALFDLSESQPISLKSLPGLSNFLLRDDYRVNNSAALAPPVASERRTF